MLKIKLYLFVLLLFVGTFAMAQNTTSVDIGAEINLPSGNFSNVSAIGLGGSVKASFPISSAFALSLNAGYTNFFGKRTQILSVQDLSYIPLKGGLKYYLGETFYVEGQLGAGIPVNDGQNKLFIWSPGIGNQFRVSGDSKLDFGIRYESWNGRNDRILGLNGTNSKGFAGLRIAYLFNL
ncbi:hypothetical protein [Pedobacter sandarakinus]|uniref:hypothetical protein n=1 Tax=Pedobacter sandarakinus TaxID=353156 RepID=UPI002247C5CE|nr:hypothetical protein [Pedobacter sandarakinus]MCX2575502.1 hypothetical protein [Pedobacter sandarakinus]